MPKLTRKDSKESNKEKKKEDAKSVKTTSDQSLRKKTQKEEGKSTRIFEPFL